MLLKRNSIVCFGGITMGLIVIITIVLLSGTNKLYGNDELLIEKVIKLIEGYENQSIEILEIKDIYDERFVAFLSNNNPAYIQFSKNQKGNYEWEYIEKRSGESFATYLIYASNDKTEILKLMIITTDKNDIAKLELDISGKVIEREFNVNQSSVIWIDVPYSKTHTYRYKFYDKDGNIIGN